MITFDGRKIRDEILEELESKIEKMKKKPVLAVILIGGDPVSVAYIGLKKKLANKIGIDVNLNYFDENISQDEVTKTIKKLNDDENITGIMVQIPVPITGVLAAVAAEVNPHMAAPVWSPPAADTVGFCWKVIVTLLVEVTQGALAIAH